MPIKVTMKGDKYEAVVTPSTRMPTSWQTDGPISGHDLLGRLLALGYHQQHVVDAFEEADDRFVDKLNRGEFNTP
jgi:hypothetical protein